MTPRIDMRITSLLEKIIVIEHEMQTSLSISKRKAEGEPGFDFVVRDTLLERCMHRRDTYRRITHRHIIHNKHTVIEYLQSQNNE